MVQSKCVLVVQLLLLQLVGENIFWGISGSSTHHEATLEIVFRHGLDGHVQTQACLPVVLWLSPATVQCS